MKKRWIVFTVLLIVALTAFLYIRFFFVFGEGVKSGELNYVVYKGLVFKTYEGKLIQSGIRSKTAGTIQSYEFEFSVENEALARKLMLLGGKTSNSTTRSISERFPGGDSRNSWSIVSSQNRSAPCRSTPKRNDNKLLRSRSKRLRPFSRNIISVRLPESADSPHVASFPTLHRFVLASDAAQQPIPLHSTSAVRISGPGAASLLVRTERVDRRTLCG